MVGTLDHNVFGKSWAPPEIGSATARERDDRRQGGGEDAATRASCRSTARACSPDRGSGALPDRADPGAERRLQLSRRAAVDPFRVARYRPRSLAGLGPTLIRGRTLEHCRCVEKARAGRYGPRSLRAFPHEPCVRVRARQSNHVKGEGFNADDQPAGPQGPRSAEGQVQGPCDGSRTRRSAASAPASIRRPRRSRTRRCARWPRSA